MSGPSPYALAAIDGQTPIYLPSSYVREQAETLLKARKQAAGRVFADYRLAQTSHGPALDRDPQQGLPFDLLRQLSDVSPIDRLIIDTRIMQVKRVARRSMGRYEVGFAVRHIRDGAEDFDVPEGLQKLAREVEETLARPTAAFHATVRDFFTSAIEEELTIDRKVMIISRDRRGRPIRFHLIDGATVRPVPAVVFEAIQAEYERGRSSILPSYDEVAYRLSESSGWDLTRAAYVQIVDGQIVGAWEDDEIAVDITNPTVRINWWGYGRSLLEKSFRLTDAFLKAWNYNLELFRLNYPEAVLAVIGDYDPEGLAAFKRKVLGEGTGVDNNWRLPVIPFPDETGKIEMVKLRDTPKDMMFAELLQALVRLKCAAYRMHPSMINFTVDSSAGGVIFRSSASEEEVISLAQEEGYQAILDSLGDWLTRSIVQEWHEDLRLVWVGVDDDTEDKRIERAERMAQSIASINEARATLGLKPMPKGIPEEPADWIGSYQQAIQMIMGQQQQQAQQGGDGYEDGDFGDQDQGQNMPPWMQQGGQGDQDQGDQDEEQGQPERTEPPGPPGAAKPARDGPLHQDGEGRALRRSMAARRRPLRHLTLTIEEE